MFKKFTLGLLIAVMLTAIAPAWAITALTQSEMDTLSYMREEEKLARDIYLSMYDQWGLDVFATLAESEQRHMDAIGNLLELYGLEDPVVSDEIGVFTNTALASLFVDLQLRGLTSEEEALRVGAYIEERDIQDLTNAITETEQRILQHLYSNLLTSSGHHLRALIAQLELMGITYEPVVIDQATLDVILEQFEPGRHGNGGSVGNALQQGAQCSGGSTSRGWM